MATTVVPASYLVPIRNGQVLLLRRANTGYEDGKLSLVAGHVEAGESALACAIREAAEEAGLTLAPSDLRCVHTMHRDSGLDWYGQRADFFFLADIGRQEPENREPAKCAGLSWHPLDCLPEDVIPFVAQALACIRAGVGYSEWGWEPGCLSQPD